MTGSNCIRSKAEWLLEQGSFKKAVECFEVVDMERADEEIKYRYNKGMAQSYYKMDNPKVSVRE